jgi:hypothetical protein
VTPECVIRDSASPPPCDMAERTPEPSDNHLERGILSLTAALPLRLSTKSRHAIGASFPETVHAASPRSAVKAYF